MTNRQLINQIRSAGHADEKGQCVWEDRFASLCAAENCLWMDVAQRKTLVLELQSATMKMKNAIQKLHVQRRRTVAKGWTGNEALYYKNAYGALLKEMQQIDMLIARSPYCVFVEKVRKFREKGLIK